MNLLITGAWRDAHDHISNIEELGHKVVYMPDESTPLPVEPEWVQGVICNGLFLKQDIRRFVNLEYIQLTSAGLDRVDLPYVQENSIALCRAQNVYSTPMAEFCLAAVLQIYKQMPCFAVHQNDCEWQKILNLTELSGKQVCIVGCGQIGRACARRFAAFECRVVGVDCDTTPLAEFAAVHPIEKLDDVLVQSDIVVLCVPLNESTKHLMNRHRIDLLKPSCMVVNIARGGVLDTQALIDRLQTDELYAVLDVHEVEPLPQDSPLWSMERVVVTPHNSFVGEGNARRLYQEIITNLKEYCDA